MKKEKKQKLLLTLLLGGFLGVQWRLLNRDFYYDEIVALVNSVFVPLRSTVSVYTNLNNHVLFSAVMNVYRQVAHISVDTAFAHPWVLRAPCAAFSCVTLVYVYLLSKRNLLAPLVLATTLPFYYYAPALRGYGLSVMLFAMAMYYVDNITHRYSQVLLFLSATLSIYVMPTNAVFILALALVNYRKMSVVLSLLLSLACGVLLYYPLIGGMLADPQLHAHGNQLRNTLGSIPEFFIAFVSYRWMLVPFAVYGVATEFGAPTKKLIYLVLLSCAPFTLIGSYLWARVLLPLCVPLSLLAAHGLQSCVNNPPNTNARS